MHFFRPHMIRLSLTHAIYIAQDTFSIFHKRALLPPGLSTYFITLILIPYLGHDTMFLFLIDIPHIKTRTNTGRQLEVSLSHASLSRTCPSLLSIQGSTNQEHRFFFIILGERKKNGGRTRYSSSCLKTKMPLLAGISSGYQRLSKYLSKAARKRLPLSPKHARKGFYKGNNCAPTGYLDSKGEFKKC